MAGDFNLTNRNIGFTDSIMTTGLTFSPGRPSVGGYTDQQVGWSQPVNLSCTPEDTVKAFEYLVINIEADPSVIVAGPTCIVAECSDEVRVAAGQATASLSIPAGSLKVLVRQFV